MRKSTIENHTVRMIAVKHNTVRTITVERITLRKITVHIWYSDEENKGEKYSTEYLYTLVQSEKNYSRRVSNC